MARRVNWNIQGKCQPDRLPETLTRHTRRAVHLIEKETLIMATDSHKKTQTIWGVSVFFCVSLWLMSHMHLNFIYSCGFFTRPRVAIETAAQAAFDPRVF